MITRTLRIRLFIVAGAWGLLTALNCLLWPPRVVPHVHIERVERAPLPLFVQAAGTLTPKDSHTVKAQLDGPVLKKLFSEGQEVHHHQLLLVLGREKIQLDDQSKKDALDNAEADLVKARREVNLQQVLFDKGAVARSAVEDTQAAVIKAEQAVRNARETFRQMQEVWDSATVYSPLNGTIVKDNVGDDKTVAAGKDLVTVADVSAFTVHAHVDELDMRSLHVGLPADVLLPVFNSVRLPGIVSQIGTALEERGITNIPVVVRITDSKNYPLHPNLTSEIIIQTGATESVLSVPAEAVANTDGETRVWMVDALHRLRMRPVQLGRSNPNRVEIVKGLHEGESVVAAAEPDFNEGMRVLIGDAAAQPQKPSRP